MDVPALVKAVSAELSTDVMAAGERSAAKAAEDYCSRHPAPAGKDAVVDARDVARIVVADAALNAMVAERLAEYMRANPPAAGKDGVPGKDGETPTIDVHDVVRELIACDEIKQAVDLATSGYVDEYCKAHPAPRGDPGRDGLNGKDGEPGKDGVGMAGAIQNKSGDLIITTTDGRTVDVGRVAGVDGKDGADGKDGRDGVDGIGFDDVTLGYDAEAREAVLTFVRGGTRKELRIPAPAFVHRGFYQPGQGFKAMEATTHNGSTWIALRDTKEQPGYESKDWVLAARKGADGNPAPVKLKHDR